MKNLNVETLTAMNKNALKLIPAIFSELAKEDSIFKTEYARDIAQQQIDKCMTISFFLDHLGCE